jgi:hypothetical protein
MTAVVFSVNKPMPAPAVFLAVWLSLVLIPLPAAALSISKESGSREYYAEFEDPYYICAGVYSSLSEKPIPTLDTVDERPVYRHLLYNILKPNCVLVEAGAYPLPLAGVAAKSWAPRQYSRATWGTTNLVRAVTESVNFKEPWSLSLFLGHTVSFKGGNGAVEGHGNIGLLCSYGYYHIKDNSLYPDHWGEFELKLKLDKSGSQRRYATSYRIGSRVHSNHDVKHLLYLCLARDRTDFDESRFSLIKNTSFQVRTDVSGRQFHVLSVTLEAGKKYPVKIRKSVFVVGLSLGASWNFKSAYAGSLARDFVPNSISPVIKPIVKF